MKFNLIFKTFLFTIIISFIFSSVIFAQATPPWPDPTNTGRTQPVYIVEATIDGVPIEIENDWIGIFDETLIVGKNQVDGLPASDPIIVFLEYTPPGGNPIPGAKYGNPMIFKIWQKSTNRVLNAGISEVVGGNPVFAEAAIVAVKLAASSVLVEQLHLLNMTYPVYYSTVGMITLFYTPEPNGYFINIIALDKNTPPQSQWIVRNLYVPDNSWIARPQSISTRFCLQSLGYFPGEIVGALNMHIHKSETVLVEMPISGEFSPMEVDTLGDDAQGDFTEVTPETPPEIDYPRFPEFDPSDQIMPIEFRGCRVPNIDLDDSAFPDTDEYAGDRNACGPASAANSLEWLDSTNTEIDIPEPLRTTMKELSKLMNRPRNEGVTIDNFIRGKLDFIEAHDLPINVKFQSSFLSNDVISSSGMTLAQNDNDGLYPTWDWLKQQMADSEDVEMMYYWHDGENWHGHAVVVTGVEENQDDSKRSVKFKHDIRQGRAGGTKQEDESIFVDNHGRMILRSRGAFIGNVVSESPGNPYPTPVELGLFTAEVVKSDVHLKWKTESESNNYGFEIFRDHEKIAFVVGKGTTAEPQAYSYIDVGLCDGSYFYELFQIDFDGTREKVGTANVVVLNKPTEFVLSQNCPNPFNATTKITYTIPERDFVSIKLYNILGEEVAGLVYEEKGAGVHTLEFDASYLVSGIYFYRMETSGFSQIRKFLLLK